VYVFQKVLKLSSPEQQWR